jgi:hypothetical protein
MRYDWRSGQDIEASAQGCAGFASFLYIYESGLHVRSA